MGERIRSYLEFRIRAHALWEPTYLVLSLPKVPPASHVDSSKAKVPQVEDIDVDERD